MSAVNKTELLADFRAGMTYEELARKYCTSKSIISNLVKVAGVSREIPRQQILETYSSGKSIFDTALLCHVSVFMVRTVLNQAGVCVRVGSKMPSALVKKQIIKRYKQRVTITDLMKEFALGRETIRIILSEAKLIKQNNGKLRGIKKTSRRRIDHDKVADMRLRNKMSINQIAAVLGVTKQAISQVLKQLGITGRR